MGSRRTRIRWVRLLLPLMVCALLCLLAAPGHAAASSAAATDDGCLKEPACSEHYQKALSLYESGRYEAALPEFQAAYESRQMPWLLINIGRTFHRLGRLDEAITLYNRYEQAVPNGDPETLKKVREYKAQAEVLLGAKSATPPPEVKPPTVDPTLVARGGSAAPQPLYKKWWFWTAIGGGVAVIVISGIAIGAATANSGPAPYPTGTPIYMPMF